MAATLLQVKRGDILEVQANHQLGEIFAAGDIVIAVQWTQGRLVVNCPGQVNTCNLDRNEVAAENVRPTTLFQAPKRAKPLHLWGGCVLEVREPQMLPGALRRQAAGSQLTVRKVHSDGDAELVDAAGERHCVRFEYLHTSNLKVKRRPKEPVKPTD